MTSEIATIRDVFIEEIYRRMHGDDRIFFLSADFGSPRLDVLRETFRDRFINVGIAEQNLINVATGLALEGFTVYAYAIAPFLTMRAYEQIRVNLSLHAQLMDMNVNLIGVGAGLSYDVSGPTHHCLEDISIMRTLPNIEVFSPSDWVLAREFVDHSIRIKRPKYMRFDGKPAPRIYRDNSEISFDSGFTELNRGEGVCLVSTGFMTHRALSVIRRLESENIRIGLVDAYLLKPFGERAFYDCIRTYPCVITLEEGFIGKAGLDSLVSGILAKNNSAIRQIALGFEDTYVFDIGNREYLHKLKKLDEDSIISQIRSIMMEV